MCGSGTRQVTRFSLVHGESGVCEPKIGLSRTGPGMFLPIMIECVLQYHKSGQTPVFGAIPGCRVACGGFCPFSQSSARK